MKFPVTSITLATIVAGFCATAAMAAPEPTGVWIDHTGRGAVEITECAGGGLCGHVVWVKDTKNKQACRTQIIGNARPVGGGTWDRGWIVDPDDDKRYSVELKPIGEDRLRVVGYMGSKLFSETMMWKRAPADLKRCDIQNTVTTTAPPAPPVQAPVSAPAAPPTAVPFPAPQREASVPSVAPAAPAPMPAYRSEPDPTPPAPETQTETVSPAPQPERRQRQAGTKAKAKECKLELPYITVQIPCDAFQ